MELRSEQEDNYWLIKINGDLDASSSIYLDNELDKQISANKMNILVDCENLNYIASAGLGVFMSYLQDLTDKKISMQLFNLNEKVLDVFNILGLSELITIVDNKKTAIASIN